MAPDLSTTYLGLALRSPIVASASPVTGRPGVAERLAAAGVGAIVLPSVFQEQLDDEDTLSETAEFALVESEEAHRRAVDLEAYNHGPAASLMLIRRSRQAADLPIIASVNWAGGPAPANYARAAEIAGAAALELNVQLVGAPEDTGGYVEERAIQAIRAVRRAISIPLAVKLSPYATSLPNLVLRVVEAGADGIVLFHRLHGARVDLDTGVLEPHLAYSTSAELGLVLRWLAALRPLVPDTSLGACSGVHDGDDAARAVAAGADAVLVAAALIEHGPDHAAVIRDGLAAALAARGHASLGDLRASIAAGTGDARLGYLDALRARMAAFRGAESGYRP